MVLCADLKKKSATRTNAQWIAKYPNGVIAVLRVVAVRNRGQWNLNCMVVQSVHRMML
jgi:hypothetical protein